MQALQRCGSISSRGVVPGSVMAIRPYVKNVTNWGQKLVLADKLGLVNINIIDSQREINEIIHNRHFWAAKAP
jgi:hypothetical protein